MLQNETYYKDLLLGFIRNSISHEQVRELYEFIHREPEKYSLLMDEPDIHFQINQQMHNQSFEIPSDVNQRMQDRLKIAVEQVNTAPVHRKSLLRQMMNNWRWAAAAVFIIGISTAVVVSLTNNRNTEIAKTNGKKNIHNDALPGKDGAILTLANGEKLILDSLGNGVVTTQGKTTVLIRNGQLVYDASVKESQVLYNTMTTPKGRQYQLVLPDGTGVWLNAASSITYPIAFVGNDRTVTITGEAYFEVAKDKSKPFHVKVNDMEVEVLGTHFNINSYAEESVIRTTLLEGSVKISEGLTASVGRTVMLRPGQQAVNTGAGITVNSDANIDQIMAWKNGMFNFNKLSLQEVLRQLSRWYDVDIVYKGTVTPKKFGGEIQRDLNLSEVLEGLQAIGVHFKIEGKKLIVMP